MFSNWKLLGFHEIRTMTQYYLPKSTEKVLLNIMHKEYNVFKKIFFHMISLLV